jgi:hypothetical protein
MTRRLRSFALAVAVAIPAVAGGGEPSNEPGAKPEVLVEATRHGGWGAPVLHATTLRGRPALFVGGRGGWLIDGRLTIGGGGLGLASRIPAPAAVHRPGESLDLEMGYGGAWVEYTFAPLRLVHVSLGALVGGGELSLRFRDGGALGSRKDAFFVTEPVLLAELNVTPWARVDVGGAYRWIVGADMAGLSYGDVAGPSVLAAVKFGKF